LQFYVDLGVKEIVLPRELTAQEIAALQQGQPGINFSYIVKNDDCPNIDGVCSYSHGLYDVSGPCTDLYNIICKSIEPSADETKKITDYNFRTRQKCKACQLQDLAAAGLKIVKIAGRGASASVLGRDVTFIKSCVKMLKKDMASYSLAARKKYSELYGRECLYCQSCVKV